jgi:cytosine/adenosine deaminase-related metal-dependent hydrolase
MAGGLHDPVAALVFCAPERAACVVINGRVIVEGGRLQTIDLPRLSERHNRLARQLVAG